MHYTIIRITKKCNTEMCELRAIQKWENLIEVKVYLHSRQHTHFLHRNY